MNDLKDLILETTRAHADIARAAYNSREREVQLLKSEITVLEEKLRRARAEILDLKARLRIEVHGD